MKINYQSDFKLYEQREEQDSTTPFKYEYKTAGFATYTAEFDGENYTNARRLDDGSLLIIFENHGLLAGELHVRREYYLNDADFSDNICNSVNIENLEITLTDGPSDQSCATVEVYPAYQKGDPFTFEDFTEEQLTEIKSDIADIIEETLEDKVSASNLVQEIGDDPTKIISQAAATDNFVQKCEIESTLAYGIQFDTSVSSPTCSRIGSNTLHATLPIQSQMVGCRLNDDGEVTEYLTDTTWGSINLSQITAEQVMIEIPAHYRKYVTKGTIREVWMSEHKIAGYEFIPKMYISAFEATVERSTNKLCSLANYTSNYRGGNNDATWSDMMRTLCGCPATDISLTDFREYARNRKPTSTEWNCMTYEAFKNLFWLFAVEYATLNSQLTINNTLTSEGYRQGGLGAGGTDLAITNQQWESYNSYNPIIECGSTSLQGNKTTSTSFYAYDLMGDIIIITTNRYRGIENPFGNIWSWMDGVFVEVTADEQGGTSTAQSRVFVCRDPANFADFTQISESGYEGYEYIGTTSREDGFITDIIFGENGDIIAAQGDGSSSTYFCDDHSTSTTQSGIKAVQFGGDASSGSLGGLTCINSCNAASATANNVGTRLCFHPQIN